MANTRISNILYVDDTTSQIDVQLKNITLKMITITRLTAASDPILQLANYDATTPKTVMKLELDASKNSDTVHFPKGLVLPDGLTIPASGLTANAVATIIYESNVNEGN